MQLLRWPLCQTSDQMGDNSVMVFFRRYCVLVSGFQKVVFRAAPFVDGEAGG
jgi:hypothetical protein